MPLILNLVLSLLALIAALLLALAWLASGQIVRRRAPDPPCNPGDLELNFEHVRFAARDGVQLGGWLTSEQGSRRPVVIFCAGQNGSMDGDTPMLPDFVKAGFDVLQFDWRAHGASGGQRCSMGVWELDDLQGAIDLVQARGIQRIGLMGFSMGATVALRAAAFDPRVRCAVLDSPFLSVDTAIAGALWQRLGRWSAPLVPRLTQLVKRMAEMRLGVTLDDATPLPFLVAPVLFIFGGADPYVPRHHQDLMGEWFHAPTRAVWRVEDAGHREAHMLRAQAYRDRVLSFFRTYLRE